MRRIVRRLFIAGSVMAATGCRDADVDRTISVVVPAQAPAMRAGVLRLALWTYDPMLADAPASLASADSVHFSRDSGTVNHFRLRVRANVAGGLKYYVTIRGFDLLPGCVRYLLWDGLDQLATPRAVVMRAVPTPSCIE